METTTLVVTTAAAVFMVSCCGALPVVDKGVFVIVGVKTCRDGFGYCILGQDCTVDKEFIPDDRKGHCDGLKKAFTPRAHFVCCAEHANSTFGATSTTTTTTTLPPPPSIEEEEEEDASAASGAVSGSVEDSGSVETSAEIGGGPFNLTMAPPTSTTQSSVIEEVHTEVSFSENFHVVMGAETLQELSGPIVTTTTTTGRTTTTTTTTPRPTTTSTTPTTTTTSTTTEKPSTTTTSTAAPRTTTRATTTTTTTARTSAPTTTTTPSPPQQQQPLLDKDTCGYKATFYSAAGVTGLGNSPPLRIDGSRLAAQQTSLVCWTGAIVRSPTSLTLQDPGSFICTGALVSEEFLLTTATCVSRLFAQDLSLFKVALGSRHLVHPMNGATPDATYMDIVQLIVHEDYNIQGLFKRVNDIALVRLAPTSSIRADELPLRSTNPTPYCTVCLPDDEEDHSGEDCIVTGFSHPTGSAATGSDFGGAGGSAAASAHAAASAAAAASAGVGNGVPSAHDSDGLLHEADQRIEYASSCEQQLTNFTVAQNTLLRNDLNIEQSKLVCASGKYNAEACFSPRDAGSPLACSTHRNPEQFRLIGVFSSGFHCGTASSPVLYTDVSKFAGWIRANMRAASEDRSRQRMG